MLPLTQRQALRMSVPNAPSAMCATDDVVVQSSVNDVLEAAECVLAGSTCLLEVSHARAPPHLWSARALTKGHRIQRAPATHGNFST